MSDTDPYYWWGVGAATFVIPWAIYFTNFLFSEFKLATTFVFSSLGFVLGIYAIYLKKEAQKK